MPEVFCVPDWVELLVEVDVLLVVEVLELSEVPETTEVPVEVEDVFCVPEELVVC